MRVLVVEDHPELGPVVRQTLEEDGYAADLSIDGEDALWRATSVEYDAIVLDLLLPTIDGFGVLAGLRKAGRTTPVLMLTALDSVGDRVRGLDAGGDDYLVKPFAMAELLARLRALVRRGPTVAGPVHRCANLSLDPGRHEVLCDDRPVEFTAKEFQLLHLLIRSPGQVLTRSSIVEHLYDDEFDGVSNTIDVFVSRLRRKLGAADCTAELVTLRGVGYVLRAMGEESDA